MSDPKDYIEIPSEAKTPVADKPMTFWGHLEELRGTLIKCLMAFVVFAALIGYYLPEFYDRLKWPLLRVQAKYPSEDLSLGSLGILDPFNIIIQLCVFGGLALSAPFMLFFVSQFVAPALSKKEKRAVIPLCLSAFVLFLLGASFGFFLLMPNTVLVSVELNLFLKIDPRWTAASYFTTLVWLVIGVGATFEFPLVIVLLVWLGILTTEFLRKYRRHAIVVIFLISAVVTPSTDFVTQIILAGPLYLLYEMAILVSSRVEKRKKML